MRRLATAAFVATLFTVPACGTDGSQPSAGDTAMSESTGPTTQQPISTEDFCAGRGAREIQSRTDDFTATMQTFSETLPELEPSDRDQLERIVGDVEDVTQALAEAYRNAAESLADPELVSDLRQVADDLEDFAVTIREAVLSGELGDTDPAAVLDESFGALSGHCE